METKFRMKREMKKYLKELGAGNLYSSSILWLKEAREKHGVDKVNRFLNLWFKLYGPNATPKN